jgi:hypothetical protein
MLDAPQHDWAYFELRKREQGCAQRALETAQDRFATYASFFDSIWMARQKLSGNWQRAEERRWNSKLAMRNRMVDAFAKLDEFRRERSVTNDAG